MPPLYHRGRTEFKSRRDRTYSEGLCLFLYAWRAPGVGHFYGLGISVFLQTAASLTALQTFFLFFDEQTKKNQKKPKTKTHRPIDASLATSSAEHWAPLLFESRLRTREDARAARRAMESGWGGALANAAGGRPDLALVAVEGEENSQRRWALRVGRSVLDCGAGEGEGEDPERREQNGPPPPPPLLLARATAPGTAASPLTLLPSQARPFAALAAALSRGWMALLVGPAGSGKTSLARAAAAAARAPLVELSLAPSADTADLLGGFEQAEASRVAAAAAVAACAAAEAVGNALASSSAASAAASASLSAVAAALGGMAGARRELESAARASAAGGGGRGGDDDNDDASLSRRVTAAARSLLAAAGAATSLLPAGSASRSAALRAAEGAAGALSAAEAATAPPAIPSSSSSNPATGAGIFEWVDGALTSAVSQGAWVLLDGANLAPPAVLDRLNPLLEPGGLLSLHEAGGGDGKSGGGVRTICPHRRFRLILSVDPATGGRSRGRCATAGSRSSWVPERMKRRRQTLATPTLTPSPSRRARACPAARWPDRWRPRSRTLSAARS